MIPEKERNALSPWNQLSRLSPLVRKLPSTRQQRPCHPPAVLTVLRTLGSRREAGIDQSYSLLEVIIVW